MGGSLFKGKKTNSSNNVKYAQDETSLINEQSQNNSLGFQQQRQTGLQSQLQSQNQFGGQQSVGSTSGINSSAQNGVTRSNFYAPAQGNINQALSDAGQIYQERRNAGPRILDFNSYETGAQQKTAELAGNNQINQAAYRQGLSEINGDYLGQDAPGLQAVRDRINRQVTQQVNSSVGAAGRTGSGAHQFGLAQGLAEGLSGIEYANYQQERDRQVAARQAAGGLAGGLYDDAARLGQVGADRRNLAQQQRFDQLDSGQQYLDDFSRISGGIAGLAGSQEQQLAQTGQQEQFNRQSAIDYLQQLSQGTTFSQQENDQLTRTLEELVAARRGQSTGSGTENSRGWIKDWQAGI